MERAGLGDIELIQGDGLDEAALPQGLFDCVVITGSCQTVPDALKNKVAPGGTLFVIQGASPAMEAVCWTRVGEQDWTSKGLFETDLPRLIGAEDPASFTF